MFRPRPLRWIVLDMNSFFASIEQAENPELEGRPVAIAPVDAESTSCIAASYEAKAYGVKCGVRIVDAREMCPGLVVVSGRHRLYSHYQKRVADAAERVLPVYEILSIDEMRFRLLGQECDAIHAADLAHRIKGHIRREVGLPITCSIGVAPNSFLAKLATGMQKPDGLTVLTADDLPEALYPLELMDFPGINRRMRARLGMAGIFSARQLCTASRIELRNAFQSVVGERWWYLLRGYDLPDEKTQRRSLGHSHVLPPEFRTEKGAREVLTRLIAKAAARMRADDLLATEMSLHVSSYEKPWGVEYRFAASSDTGLFNRLMTQAWATADFEEPRKVSVTFSGLSLRDDLTPSLFEEGHVERLRLMKALDGLNRRYGHSAVHIASSTHAVDEAEERIAFRKIDLFDEGPSVPQRIRQDRLADTLTP